MKKAFLGLILLLPSCDCIDYAKADKATYDTLAEDIFVGTDNLSILWIGYLIFTVAFPVGNYIAWDKYEAK